MAAKPLSKRFRQPDRQPITLGLLHAHVNGRAAVDEMQAHDGFGIRLRNQFGGEPCPHPDVCCVAFHLFVCFTEIAEDIFDCGQRLFQISDRAAIIKQRH